MLKTSIKKADPKGQVLTALLTMRVLQTYHHPHKHIRETVISFYMFGCLSLRTDVPSVFETFWLGGSGAVSAATGESSRTA